MSTLILGLSLFTVFYVATRWRWSQRSLPPGPKPLPIIGNLLDMPTNLPWVKYREWCNIYRSDVVYVHLPFRQSVILGSYQAAIDLLDKRSHLYSDRVASVMDELMTWDFNLGVMPYTQRWRTHRRMFHQQFYSGTVNRYRPAQLRGVRKFLLWILKSPQHSRELIRLMVTSVVVQVAYGKKISSMNDDYVITAEKALEGFGKAAIPGMFWVEYLPFLKHIPSWVPGTYSRQFAEAYLPHVINMRDKPYSETKLAVSNGTATASLARFLIEDNREKYGGTDEEAFYDDVAKNVAGLAYAAGSDTTTSACQSFLLAMALFPEVQKRAQAELDKVVEPTRLPDYDDIENLPYMQAMVMEVMRWMPVLPISVPHAVVADDSYKGYRIPKGSIIIPNAWAMLHNPVDYPQPESFEPERYLDKDGEIDPNVLDPLKIAFGFGRRICLGRHFSNNTLSLYIASVLHVFDVSAGSDADGKTIELSDAMTTGIIATPCDVPCGLTPRSERAAQLIHKSALEFDD